MCTVHYYPKCPVIKKTDDLPGDCLIRVVMIVFVKFGLQKKLMSDAGTNYISERFRQFCRQLNIEQAITSSYQHKSNDQVEAQIKFIKHTIKICLDNNDDSTLALLQIRSTMVGTGLPSPVTLLFNRPIRALLPQIYMDIINFNSDDEHYEVLKTHNEKYIKDNDTCRRLIFFPYRVYRSCPA